MTDPDSEELRDYQPGLAHLKDLASKVREGDVVTGPVVSEIEGGLLVDIGTGVHAFLPADQVDIGPPRDLRTFIGRTLQCLVMKLDETGRAVVSRRALITSVHVYPKRNLERFVPGQIHKGVVKNIAEFGAFVDLGGIDGLLHITDMSDRPLGHPSEMVQMDQEIEVMILNVDREKEKIALGLKQKLPRP